MKRRMDKSIIENESDTRIDDLISQVLGESNSNNDGGDDMIDIDPVEFDLYDEVDRVAEYKDQIARDWKIIDETEVGSGDEEFIPKKKQKFNEENLDVNLLRLQNKKYFIQNHEITSQIDSLAHSSIQILGTRNEGNNLYFISREDFFSLTKLYPGQILQNRIKWIRLEKNHDRQSTLFSPLSKNDELILKSKFGFRGASFYILVEEISKKVEIPEITSLYNTLYPETFQE